VVGFRCSVLSFWVWVMNLGYRFTRFRVQGLGLRGFIFTVKCTVSLSPLFNALQLDPGGVELEGPCAGEVVRRLCAAHLVESRQRGGQGVGCRRKDVGFRV